MNSNDMTNIADISPLGLIPTVWRQSLRSADPQPPPHETKCLSLHAKADWLSGSNWFDDPALSDILFEVDILSDTTALKRGPPEWKGTIGGLRYCNGWQIPETGEKFGSFVRGIFSVSDAVFEDLWERVKLHVALPSRLSLEVLGLQCDASTSFRDYWDLKKQPKLKVLSADLQFRVEQPGSSYPNSKQPNP